MRKVELNMTEENKYNIIKKLVETDGNKKRAALKIGCTLRNVNRLIAKYKKEGKAGFMHKNKGRRPAKAFDEETKRFVIDLYKEKFTDTNFAHYCEILNKHYDIKISDTCVNNWLRAEGILSPKARRKTKKNQKKILRAKLKEEKLEKQKNKIKESIERVDESLAHPRRPRCKYMGEMIQMDASEFVWAPEAGKWHLHVAIDDASGKIVGAYFDYQETLNGYYQVARQIFANEGVPAMFYTDKRTVFEYKKKSASDVQKEDTFTQFAYMCSHLGIEIKTTSVAQAKGRVERLNQTLQSRLPVELRLAGINTIEEANKFLTESYIKEFNEEFSLHLDSSKSVYEKQLTETQINKACAVIEERKIDSGHSFQYHKKHYMVTTANGSDIYFKKGTEVLVIKCLDDTLYVNVNDRLYTIREIENWQKYSESFDVKPELKKEKKKYIPPLDHPWRKNSWKLYSSSMKQHLYGANNKIFLGHFQNCLT